MQPTRDNVFSPYQTPLARAADGQRWYGWDNVNRQRNFFFEFFIDYHQLKAAGGEARVEGDLSYPAVDMLIFASCPTVSNRTGSPSFNAPRPFLTLGSGVVLRRGVP